ncbi:MAG: Asp/Glu/hydantoin racemase [Pseudomonadota bacterium]
MKHRRKLGLLTPSSNTIMEPRAAEVVSGLDDVSVHFTRVEVTEISMRDGVLWQPGFEPQLKAANLLAQARMDVIAWGGTSGGWVGLEADKELCRQITERTAVPSTTSTLALLAAFQAFEVETYSLVTPYLSEIQSAIQTNFSEIGYSCLAERHLNDKGNYSFSEYDETTIERMVRDVATARPDAIVIHCTNFDGTRIAPVLERELSLPVFDSISLTMWHSLCLASCDPGHLKNWGKLFSRAAP